MATVVTETRRAAAIPACLFAWLLPGAGHLYLKRTVKGLVFLGAIGTLFALGVAMDQTGTAKYLSQLITGWTREWGPNALLSGFFILTVALTQPMSNQAAAILVLPIAIESAVHLGLNPRTFAMMVAVAASCSYLTPKNNILSWIV